MTLRHLQIFQTVCRCMSITQAAEQLNMTQPAVSIAVRELESFYGTRLFERLNRRIYLTDAGQSLEHYAKTILEDFSESVATLRGGKQHLHLRVGANVTAAETFLPELLVRLQERLPGLTLQTVLGNTAEIDRRLRDNEIDVAILDEAAPSPDLESRPLREVEMCAVCSESFPAPPSLSLPALCTYPLLLREEGSGSRRCIEELCQLRRLSLRPATSGSSSLALLRLAQSGLGIAILPQELLHSSAGRLLRRLTVTDTVFLRRFVLIRRKKKLLSPALCQALDEL